MKNIFGLFGLCMALLASSANALVIDTRDTWTGDINESWFGSGQSFTVDANETLLEDLSFNFAAASNGRIFDFRLTDAPGGGNTLFSTSFLVANGVGFIDINTQLAAGSQVYALIDYRGYSGPAAYYQQDVYAGGNSYFYDGAIFWGYPAFDHVFLANFSRPGQAPDPVPEPGSLALFGLGLLGIGLARKGKSAAGQARRGTASERAYQPLSSGWL